MSAHWRISGMLLVGAILAAGCTGLPQKSGDLEVQQSTSAPQEVTVYFADQDANHLIPVKRPIGEGEKPIEAAIKALVRGPSADERLVPTIPQGTRLLGYHVQGGTAVLNLSGEFRRNHSGGSTGEIMTLYSVANTLTEFQGIERVMFHLDGRPLDAFIHMSLSRGLTRRQDLIQKP